MYKVKSLLSLACISIIAFVPGGCGVSEDQGKFVKLSPDKTNIRFFNTINENDSINIFDFANIYNGGGVGVGDFNNDSLQDLYFTGNMTPNKLYLNRGKMTFDDITGPSQTEGKGVWSRGVAVVDINNDGWMDMYVCATAKRNPVERVNILYVNQGLNKDGIPVFKDLAQEYGLADTTQSTMAYFFDYDNDNDLDLFIAVNHIQKDEYTNAFRPRLLKGEHPSTGKLYRNDWNEELKHPVYKDVSREAGITIEGFTHAANIFDANNDGWQDILVLNDYISSNVLYINNHDGTFTDRVTDYFKHTAANSMGSDAVDLNNDGWDDVIEVDMLPEDNYRKKMFQSPNNYLTYQNSDYYKYQYQYVRNMIHINQGPTMGQQDSISHPVFSDIGFFAGIAETDWSWTPLVADFDEDGNRDILFTNGFPKDVTDHDFIAYRKMASRLVSKKDMQDEIPEVKIHNYMFRNEGNLRFSDKTNDWGFETPGFSNGAAYVDLDNDGDLDVVINHIDDPASVYENRITGGNTSMFLNISFKGSPQNIGGIGTKVRVYQKDTVQTFVNNPYRGYLSTVSTTMHFGLGGKVVDSVVILWPGTLKQVIVNPATNQTIHADIKNAIASQPAGMPAIATGNWFSNITGEAGINYVHQQREFIDFNIQKLLPHKFTEYVPGIAAGDINGDGLDDFITGASPGFSAMIFTQNASGKFTSKPLLDAKAATQKRSDDRSLLLFDADNDNDPDLYISAGGYAYDPGDSGYEDAFYINNGKGVFTKDSLALPVNRTSKFCVRASDFDKDGDLDLFVAGRVNPHNYPQAVSSFIYRNDLNNGRAAFTDVTKTVAPALENIGLTCDAVFTDFDNDSWPDLILAGEWMPVKFFKNDRGTFKDVSSSSGVSDKSGWWNSITTGDYDSDGDIDYVVGNLGQNSYYKATDQYPMSVYAKDFNNDGVLECIPTKYILDSTNGTMKEYTTHTRDDIVDPMPFLKKRFLSYKSFARATFDQLFTQEEARNMTKLSANYLSSALFRNEGNGRFSVHALPDVAQFSVINGMITDDFDGDGNLDLCMNTNDYGTEVGNGRYDALNGLVLKGDGKGGFLPMTMLESGISIRGDGKGLCKLLGAGNQYLVAATQNKGPVQLYRNKKQVTSARLQPDDVFATMSFADGRKHRTECYYGSSFLSQSSRLLAIPANAITCIVTNREGKERKIK